MKLNFIITAFLLVLLFACSSSSEITKSDIKEIYFENNINKEKHPTDFVAISNAKIDGDILILEINYSGGCQTHFFDLIVETNFSGKNPPETKALLSHNANGDACKMMIDEELKFNLEPWKKLCKEKFSTNELKINFMDNNLSVNYKF